MKKGRVVPKCEKEETVVEKRGLWDNIHARRKAGKTKEKTWVIKLSKDIDIESYTMLDKVEDESTCSMLNEKAVSRKQQRFFGMVRQSQKGEAKLPHLRLPELLPA